MRLTAEETVMTVLTTTVAEEAIRRLTPPVSEAVQARVYELIDADARVVRTLNLRRWFAELEKAKAAAQYSLLRLEETRRRLAAAWRDLEQSEPVKLLKAFLCFLCWIACAGGEFAITWSTIPFALNIPEESFLGIVVSAIPVAALTVLEWAIARALEEPYQEAFRSYSATVHTASRFRRLSAHVLMGVFLAVLIAGNLYTVRLLASARGQAATLRHNLERGADEAEQAVDEAVIDRAIVAVSVAVVVDGALLFLIMWGDVKSLNLRLRASLRIALDGRRLTRREKTYLDARAVEASIQRDWDERVERVDAIVEDFKARRLLELRQVLDREVVAATRTLDEIVDDILVRSATSPARQSEE